MKKLIIIAIMELSVNSVYSQLPSCFNMLNTCTDSIEINQSFDSSQIIYPFSTIEYLTGLEFKGSIEHSSDNSLIRLILIDSANNEYLLYESYPLLADFLTFTIDGACEETALLDSIHPIAIKIDILNFEVHIDKLYLSSESFPDYNNYQVNQIHNLQIDHKIYQINELIQIYNLAWIADSTTISHLFYKEKKGLTELRTPIYLQGFEYYYSGVYDIPNNYYDNSSINNNALTVDDFDWRDRHHARDMSSPYYDCSAYNSGWITSIKNQLPSPTCGFFTLTAIIEALTNLYYNRFIHADLSEQHFISCYIHIPYPYQLLDSVCHFGIVNDSCFPYNNSSYYATFPTFTPCSTKCEEPDYHIKPDTAIVINSSNIPTSIRADSIKQLLIYNGPLLISFGGHAMCLVGYYNDFELNKIVWIYKNSVGLDSTNNIIKGYTYSSFDITSITGIGGIISFKEPITHSCLYVDSILCADYDNDSYYNWGIGTKPAHCPPSPDLEDCDDSDPSFGPMDKDGSCSRLIPYGMSFEEDTLYDWRQSRRDDFNWTIRSGETPTTNTGPDSASAGNYYIYTEATNQAEDDTACLISPSIYLSGSCNFLHFSYHMYGSGMGSLAVAVSEDGGRNWSAPVWSKSGDQGNAWDTALVRLDDYQDMIIKIKFTAVIGPDSTSDMALDDIRVGHPPDLELSTNSPLCSYDTLRLLAGPGPFTYSWTGPNEFESTMQNPVITNADTNYSSYYICTIEDTNACLTTDSIYVNIYYCCSDSTLTLLSDTVISKVEGNLPDHIAIKGALIIDTAWSFSPYTEITMLAGSSIHVMGNASLEIAYANIHGCDSLWSSISVQPGGTLWIRNSSIEDGEYAVTAHDSTVIYMVSNHFHGNYIGFYLPPLSPGASSQCLEYLNFSNNEFDCEDDVLLAPYQGQISKAGVLINDQLIIPLYGSDTNRYHDLRNGVIAYNTQLVIENSKFYNITDTSTYDGRGIYIASDEVPGVLLQEGWGKYGDTTFKNCKVAIDAVYTNSYIRNNKMYGNETSVAIEAGRYCYQEIHDNYIEANATGILMFQNDPVADVDISDNYIRINSSLTQSPTSAISIFESGIPPLNNYEIHDDSLMMDSCKFGLRMYVSDSVFTYYNYFYLNQPSKNQFGINLEYCPENEVFCNILKGISPTQGDVNKHWPRGLRASGTQNTRFSCNYFDDIMVGASFENDCYGDSVQGNEFNEHLWGLHYNEYAITGPQRHKGNKWFGTYSGGYGAIHEGQYQYYTLSVYHCKTSPSYFFPPSVLPSSGWLYSTGDTITYTCFLCSNIDTSEKGLFGDIEHAIARGDTLNEDFIDESKWISARYLYDKLITDTVVSYSDTLIQNFYDSIQNVSAGDYQEFEHEVKQALRIGDGIKSELAGNLDEIRNRISSLLQVDSLLFASVSVTDSLELVSERQARVTLLRNSIAQWSSTFQVVNTNLQAKIDTLIVKNSQLSSATVIEQNEKKINDIYLRKIVNGDYSFSQDEGQDLREIACQCPLSGGKAVIKARSYLAREKDTIFDDKELCIQAGVKNKQIKPSHPQTTGFTFQVYPNPAYATVTLEWNYQVKDMIAVAIYDLLGRRVLSTEFLPANLNKEIRIDDLPPGSYKVCLRTTGMHYCTKLVVIK